jgi:hypothetical protein
MAEKKETIAEGMGLNEEWALINRHRAEKILEENNTVSDALLSMAADLREEEFGGGIEISIYEKKLIMMGFHLAQLIMQKQQESVIGASLQALQTLQELRKNLDE